MIEPDTAATAIHHALAQHLHLVLWRHAHWQRAEGSLSL